MMPTASLERDLRSHGFIVSYRNDACGEIVFARRRSKDAFERIRLNFGSKGNTASVGVEISIAPGRTALKSLCRYRCLVSVATDAKRGITDLSGHNEAEELYVRVVDHAPRACEELANQELEGLLRETQSARDAAERYLILINQLGADQTAKRVSPEAQIEIDRIWRQRFVCIPGGEHYYLLALQAIAVGCKEIEGDGSWLKGRDVDTRDDRGLLIRLQLMASRLACEQGWSGSGIH